MILTPQGWLQDGILSFDAEGRLLRIEQTDRIDAQQNVEFYNGALVPGFVNAHCHLELSYLKGRIARGGGLAAFADAIASERGKTSPEERAAAAAYWDCRMFRDGVTAVGDICNGTSTFPLKRKSPVRYHNFVECFGLRAQDFTPMRTVLRECTGSGLEGSLTPHSAYSLQDAPFRAVAAESHRLSVHFMESRSEAELYRARGPLHERNLRERVTIDFAGYGSPAKRILDSVPPDRPLLLVHGTFASRQEIESLAGRFGDRLSWVLCPRSNDYIEGARPPVETLRRAGVRIALGTDSLSSNETLSIVEELKMLRSVPLDEALRWATLGGAEALGIDSWAGSFVPGKRPGAVLLGGIDFRTTTLRDDAFSRRIL